MISSKSLFISTVLAASVFGLSQASAAGNRGSKAYQVYKATTSDTVKSSASSASRSSVEASRISSSKNIAPAGAMMDRPMVLSKNVMQMSTEVGMSHTSVMPGYGETSFGTNYGFEMGAGSGLQFGAAIAIPFTPKFTIGYFMTDSQYAVTDFMNLRLNLGMNSITYPTAQGATMNPDGSFNPGHATNTSFAGGIGAPLRLKLNPSWALISGRSNVLSVLHTSSFAASQTDDIFTFHMNGDGNYTTLGLPVGVEHAFNAKWTGRFRTGIRGMMGNGSGTYIPLAFDALVSPARGYDLGATIAFAGTISGTGIGFFDNQGLTLWGQTRF